MHERSGLNLWQSFADLAMGLMATLMLILVLVLIQSNAQLESQAEKDRELIKTLVDGLHTSQRLQSGRERVNRWVASVFDVTSCPDLSFDPSTSSLQLKGASEAQLFDSGETKLKKKARKAIRDCSETFQALAVCLSQDRDEECRSRLRKLGVSDLEGADAYRRTVDAVVLQGNTDRDTRETRVRELRGDAAKFHYNTRVGTERARSALYELLRVVQADKDTDNTQALRLLLAHVSIETPAFGRYQPGLSKAELCPQDDPCDEWFFDPKCVERDRCESARNLNLRLRWRSRQLEAPFKKVREVFCQKWRDNRGLKATLDPEGRKKAAALCGDAS